VANSLDTGINVIAVEVHFHGVMKSYGMSTLPGLLVQLEIPENNDVRYIASDAQWKVIKDTGWDSRCEYVSTINGNNFSSCTSMNRVPYNWQLAKFDDSNWDNAIYPILTGEFPVAKPEVRPYAIRRPWLELMPRDLPPLIEYDKEAYKVYQLYESPQFSKYGHWNSKQQKSYDAHQQIIQDVYVPLNKCSIDNMDDFLKGESSLVVKNYVPSPSRQAKEALYHTTIVFDYEKVIDGYPFFVAEGKAGTMVDIQYVPYLVDDIFVSNVIINNYSDRIILSGNRDQWEGSEIRPMRYMAVTIRGNEPVTFGKIGFRIEEYPFIKKEPIEVPEEPFIKKMWTACEDTLQGITTDAFTDNYQERRQYSQTSFYASLGNYGVYGDTYIQRRYLVQVAQNQFPNGIMPMWAPWFDYDESNSIPGIFEASHFWLMGLRDYYLYTGDKETLDMLLPHARKLANELLRLQNADDLMYAPPYKFWIDWAKISFGEINFIINALQLLTFSYYGEILTWIGEKESAKKWKDESEKIRISLKRFWSEKKQLFAGNMNKGELDNSFTEHANSLAVVSGIANSEQSYIIVEKLINNVKNPVMEESVLFNYWVVEALCQNGKTKEAIAFFKERYGHMLKEGENGTLWEYSKLYVQDSGSRDFNNKYEWKGRSWCTSQGENCFSGITLSQHVLGLRVISPGANEIEISSLFSQYNNFSGMLPTHRGEIHVARENNKIQLIIPDDIKAIIDLNKLKKCQKKNLTVDTDIFIISKLSEDVSMGPGKHLLILE
jgi:hypothetical protein